MNPEILGVTATLFVLLSFLMKKPKSIRSVNIIGAALFVVYGLMINAFSMWLLNGALIIIHLVFLHRENKQNRSEETTK